MLCNADVLFSVLVLHWVTQIDSTRTSSSNGSHHPATDLNRATDERASRCAPEERKGIPLGIITTECRGVSFHKERGSEDQIVELHKIRVQTEHVREVELEADVRSEGSGHTDATTFRGQERMSTEKIV